MSSVLNIFTKLLIVLKNNRKDIRMILKKIKKFEVIDGNKELELNVMKLQFVFYLAMTLLASCNNSEIGQKSINSEESVNPKVAIIEEIQDSNNILGDKIILSDSTDTNGLTSPDTIYVIKSFKDSSNAINFIAGKKNQLFVLNLNDYYFANKPDGFIVFSKTEPRIKNTKKIIFKIRSNNFRDDCNASSEQLDSLYKNYYVIKLLNEELYLIKPKKKYHLSRMFSRLIKYEHFDKRQDITINDFEYESICRTEKGYLLGLNDFGYGASNYFADSTYSIKLIWLTNQLKIKKEYQLYLESTKLVDVKSFKSYHLATFELHLGCDGCPQSFCIYNVKFNKNYQPFEIEIIEKPKTHNVSSDSLLYPIKKQTSYNRNSHGRISY